MVGGITVSNGVLSVNPSVFRHLAAGQPQEVVVNFHVVDEHGGFTPQSATITVAGTNDVPEVAAALRVMRRDTDAAFSIDLLQGATDPDDGAVLSVSSVTGLVDGLELAGTSLSVDPSVYRRLAQGEQEQLNLTYDVVDEGGKFGPANIGRNDRRHERCADGRRSPAQMDG